MGRIKGWRKMGADFWVHRNPDKSGTYLAVEQNVYYRGMWVVKYNNEKGTTKILRKDKRKAMALKYAMAWMKKHPKG